MDTFLERFPGFINQFQNLPNGSRFNHNPTHLYQPNNSIQSSSSSSSSEDDDNNNNSSREKHETSNSILKYISEILMEEEDESLDCLAVQAAEKSFYDVLGQKYPPPVPKQPPLNISSHESKGRKNHHREGLEESDDDSNQGRRCRKQTALYIHEDPEPPEIFDQVLLHHGENSSFQSSQVENIKKLIQKSSRSKKNEKDKEVVDLWTLLTQCAQAVANHDQVTAKELIERIQNNSSPFGDGTERLAHYFVNGLETRLSAGTLLYMPLASNEFSASEILGGYQVYVTTCPFRRMSNFVANRTILKLSRKAKAIHIIDFGILYGFQWPCLIQRLSERRVGPPKLRITGIENPEPGFRPSERVEETGRRLEKYCKRFNVEFKYKVIIAQKWESIKLEDLEVDQDEFTVVNCIHRLKNVPDETLITKSPREMVLNLVRRANPDVFVHGVVNGTYNAPFFLTRFREALYHFSALFDMFEATTGRDNWDRHMFEKGSFGRDAMNVIACEGIERVERPESYKQWQVRNLKAGFKQIALNQEILKKVKKMVESEYHEEFVVDVDGHFMLQGWKGRIIHALSCWVPA